MTITTTKLTMTYYAVLAAITVGFATFTVFTGGMFVTHGQKVAQLENQIHTLQLEQKDLERTLARASTFSSVQELAQQEGYQPNSAVIALTPTALVASR